MSEIFISHVEEDAEVALEIALGLEEAGYTTWCYEVDNIPGPSYLIQTGQAVEQAKALVLIISPHSLSSHQVTKEVIRAHEGGKVFIPVLRDITHIEFQNRQPEWREALGAATSMRIEMTQGRPRASTCWDSTILYLRQSHHNNKLLYNKAEISRKVTWW